jgi:G:T-mismatch repair DNA endonuclease (very short patch repair protein)
MDKIKCRLCENEYGIKQFGMHISKTHKMLYEDYAKQYWEDLPKWSPCKECGNICKDSYCSKECMSIGLSKNKKGKKQPPRSKEHTRKLSEVAKQRLSNPENHPMYGKNHSKQTLEKISKTQKERLKDVTKHGMYGKTHNEKTIEKMSKGRIEYYKVNPAPFKGKTHTPESIRKIFQNKPMNKLEKVVADYLDTCGIKYTFQFFINSGGVCKSYDFKLKNSNIILEIHGDYWHGGNGVKKHVFNVDENIQNDKLKNNIAKSIGYNVIVVWESEIKEDISIINKKINEYLYKSKTNYHA